MVAFSGVILAYKGDELLQSCKELVGVVEEILDVIMPSFLDP